MSIRIITDSASDIEQNELENVQVLPLTVTIDDTVYRDSVDLTKDEFFRILETSETIPVSSLVSPHQFEEAFAALPEGDEAIVLTISSGISGTYQSAMIASEDYANVSVVDSLQVSAALKLLVLYAQKLISQGKSRAEIVAELEEQKKRIIIFAAADTLKYLLKGGRISRGTALVGGIIGIKPIVTLEDGKLISVGKARGSKQSHSFMTKMVQEVGGIDFDMPFAVGYSGTDDSNMRRYMAANHDLMEGHEPLVVQIGTAVGTHCGPGAVLVTFFANKQK